MKSPLYIGGSEYEPDITRDPNVKRKEEIIRIKGDVIWVKITYSTSAGDLIEIRCCPEDEVDWCVKHPVDDPVNDYDKIRYLIGDLGSFNTNFSDHEEMQKAVGDEGVLHLGFNTPWDQWIEIRGMAGLTDCFDYPEIMERFCEDYLDYIIEGWT